MALPHSAPTGLAFDARSLDALRRDAGRDPKAAVRQAAGQFEALFMQQLLKSMRDAMPKSGMFDGPERDTYVGMLDQQLAQSMSNRPGGLAEMIARQLSRHMAPEGGVGAAASGDGRRAGVGPAGSVTQPAASRMRASPPSATSAISSPSLDPAAAAQLEASLTRRLDAKQASFVERMWPHALSAQRSTGVPAAFIVGQAALETGWGGHEIRHADGRSAHNPFGIKAGSGWDGATVDVATTEYVDGKPTRVVDRFRSYSSYAEAFRDWASLMSAHERYGPVLRARQSAESFAQGMQRAGYATDPRYADKLERTINQALLLRRLGV